MKEIHSSQSKIIILLLTNDFSLSEKVIMALRKKLGLLELQSPWFDFEYTDYYEDELGKNLKRCLLGFKNILEPYKLTKLKKFTNRVEKKFSEEKKRAINIDPGYVDLFKVVLASGKSGGQKIALSKDVYAHPILRFEHNKWIHFSWTFPDFQSKQYHGELLSLRNTLKLKLRHSERSEKSQC